MGRPRVHKSLHDSQAAYHQSEKGKAAVTKYESSELARARKRLWWQQQHGSKVLDLKAEFISLYGSPDVAFSVLDEREQKILTLYFGLDGGEPQSPDAIAKMLDIPKGNVSRIKGNALRKASYLHRKSQSTAS